MAYFPNGSAGEVFNEQCSRCRFGEGSCPVYFVQYTYNYDAANNEVATKILDALVRDSGECQMFKLDPELFSTEGPTRDTVREMLDAMGEKP